MIGIRVSGDTRHVADELSRLRAVDYVVLTAGTFDILAEVVCEDDDDLIELLNTKIRGIDGVQSTGTGPHCGPDSFPHPHTLSQHWTHSS